jgi:anaerobic nitric oxide reductase transcription regulator
MITPRLAPRLSAFSAAAIDTPEEKVEAPLRSLSVTVDECQRQAILKALERCGQNWAGAARLLEIDPSNLHKLARRLGLK